MEVEPITAVVAVERHRPVRKKRYIVKIRLAFNINWKLTTLFISYHFYKFAFSPFYLLLFYNLQSQSLIFISGNLVGY